MDGTMETTHVTMPVTHKGSTLAVVHEDRTNNEQKRDNDQYEQ